MHYCACLWSFATNGCNINWRLLSNSYSKLPTNWSMTYSKMTATHVTVTVNEQCTHKPAHVCCIHVIYAIDRRRLLHSLKSVIPVSRFVVVIGWKVCLSISLTEPSRYAIAIYWNNTFEDEQSPWGGDITLAVELPLAYDTGKRGTATEVGRLAWDMVDWWTHSCSHKTGKYDHIITRQNTWMV